MAGLFFLIIVPLYLCNFVGAFVHPGLLVTDTDFARIKQKLLVEAEPWASSYQTLTSIRFSQTAYTAAPAVVVRRSEPTGEQLWHDAAAAFDLALRYKISDDEQYAAASAKVLTAWATTFTGFFDEDDSYLSSGLQGYQLANAAELLSTYEPFQQNGFDAVADMLNSIFLPMNLRFLNHELPSEHNVKHFHANWELCNLASAMAIGVLTDNQTAWDFAVDYFKNGDGNGAIENAITNIVAEPDSGKPLGQIQESGRDQGHTGMDMQLLGVIAQQGYNQGEDLFALSSNRILLAAEYYARYNLGFDVPFVPWTNNIVSFATISSASRGAIRPAWELLYNHYAVVKGLDAPWTLKYRDNVLDFFHGAEGGAGSWGEGSGHYDGLGWGSLLYRLNISDVGEASSATIISMSSSATSSSPPISSTTTGKPGTTTTSSSSVTRTIIETSSPATSPSRPISSTTTGKPGTTTASSDSVTTKASLATASNLSTTNISSSSFLSSFTIPNIHPPTGSSDDTALPTKFITFFKPTKTAFTAPTATGQAFPDNLSSVSLEPGSCYVFYAEDN